MFGATEGGDVTLLHIGLRDHHKVEKGHAMEQHVLMLPYRRRALNVFGLFFSSFSVAGHARDRVLAHKQWTE